MNILKYCGVIGGPIGRTAAEAVTFIGNAILLVLAIKVDFIEQLVTPNDKAIAGQRLVVQRNAFGEVVAEYASAVDSEIGAIRNDSSSDPGNVLMFILLHQQAGPMATTRNSRCEVLRIQKQAMKLAKLSCSTCGPVNIYKLARRPIS